MTVPSISTTAILTGSSSIRTIIASWKATKNFSTISLHYLLSYRRVVSGPSGIPVSSVSVRTTTYVH